ncbi:MAG: phenylalanine--tRNA ligase subunit beta, partial [Chloroflexi bacterium]|nr:phenylalanine--tRNA ligase subunit beta [Chloroflexota bacterium]
MPTMRVSLQWLSDYVELPDSVEELDRRLTASGTEVSKVTRIGAQWDENVKIALIIKVEPHPNADRLQLATVDLGDREQVVVCGAPNIAAGQRVPIALVGAALTNYQTGEREVLKAAKIRGIASNGMLCSERELGISGEHEGILLLDAAAPVGASLRSYLGDTVLDLDVTPNRSDCLSVLGVARETAALFGGTVKEPDAGYPATLGPVAALAQVEIADAALCPRYTAVVIKGVTIGPSPAWMQRRLEAAGMRPINNIVDVTNYVMLEYGQPLHAFDYDRLRGGRIVVRSAHPGEEMTTLDNQHRELDPDMLLICDGEGPVAIAGVMGGLESEVTAETVNILLESACFNNISIR